MRFFRLSVALLLALAAPFLPAAALAQTAQQTAPPTAPDFFTELDAFYETAGAPRYVNDAPGRLAIYRATLARLEAAPPQIRADPRYAGQHLFYSVSIATTLTDAGQAEQSRSEVARLIPLVRAAHRDRPDDRTMTEALARLLRVEGQAAQVGGDRSTALSRYREVIALTRSLLPADAGSASPYILRSFAIDLDNLSNMEAQAGNRAEADRSSAGALELFRILARNNPDSRPAQGSLLIALARRAGNFGDMTALGEAEQQMALMDRQGMMTPNYAPVRDLLAAMRSRSPR